MRLPLNDSQSTSRVQDTHQWTVTPNEHASRLDTFLIRRLPALSRPEIAEHIASGRVFVNDRPRKKGVRIRSGDTVTLCAGITLTPCPTLPVRVVYADAAIVCLEKPPGLPSVAQRTSNLHTVANFLAAHFPDTLTAGKQAPEAGLLHRLDTPTSGLLLAARTPDAYSFLREQFRLRKVEKQYTALVVGSLQCRKKRVRFFLAPRGPGRRQMELVPLGCGQEAISIYKPVAFHPRYTLVRITLVTGVRHQIRAHLAALGHPIVGDTQYGTLTATRLYLHAEVLAFSHPVTRQRMRLTSPPPPEFAEIFVTPQ